MYNNKEEFDSNTTFLKIKYIIDYEIFIKLLKDYLIKHVIFIFML